MKPKFTYHFDWDPTKATADRRKHGVDFSAAMTVFIDPLSLTRHDSEHSQAEERWVTIGRTDSLVTLIVVHTFEQTRSGEAYIRIISARPATNSERKQYEEHPLSVQESKPMQNEYDFSGAERGKFFRRDAVLNMPVHLEPDVLKYFTERAQELEVTIDALLNDVLKREIAKAKKRG